MFKLHDKTRRLLTLLILLLLGPALLFAVLIKVGSRHSVHTVVEWEVLLTNTLGKRVSMERVSFPAPGVVRFLQVEIIDAETNTTLLQIPQWELIECIGEMPQYVQPTTTSQTDGTKDFPTSKRGASGEFYEPYLQRTPFKRGLTASIKYAFSNAFGTRQRYWHCEIPEISCHDTAIPQAKTALLDLMAKLPTMQANGKHSQIGVKPAVLFVGSIDIFFKTYKQKPDCVTLKNACVEFRPDAEKTGVSAVFQQAGLPPDAEPLRLVVSRQRGSTASTRIEFATGGNEIPTRLPARIDPFFDGFGAQSRFKGTITAEHSLDKQKQQLRTLELSQAAFSNVSLDSLLSKSLTFRLDGTADEITLKSAKFVGDSSDSNALRLEYAEGTIINATGLASWPGLHRLVAGTRLQLSPPNAAPPDTDVAFRDGTFAFIFDSQGIRLGPKRVSSPLGPPMPGPLMVIVNQCEVHWPEERGVIRYNELLTALALPNSQHIPLTPETQRLLGTLPATPNAVAPNAVASPVTAEYALPQQQSQQPMQRPGLRETLAGSSNGQSPPIQPPVQQPPMQSQMQPSQMNFTSDQHLNLQPPQSDRVAQQPRPADYGTSPMMAVPPLSASQEPYPRQSQPTQTQPTPATPTYSQYRRQEESFQPSQPVAEYLFLSPPNSTTGQRTVLSEPQSVQPYNHQAYYPQQGAMNVAMPQPGNVPYGQNATYATQQQRVRIPAISGRSNQVQTGRESSNSFNGTSSTFVDPFETQLATAPQSQRYYDATSQPMSGSFQMWQSDRPQGIR